MPLQLDDFLHSFAKYLVARAAAFVPRVDIVYGPQKNNELYRWESPEKDAAPDLYSTLIIYGGLSSPRHPKPVVNLQCATYGKSNKAAVNRAQTLFDAGLADDLTPLRMTSIPASKAVDDSDDGQWLLINVDWIQRPGLVGRDDRGRAKVIYNQDVGIQKL